MPPSRSRSLRDALGDAADCSDRFLWGRNAAVCLSDLVTGTGLGCRPDQLLGRSILVATHDQLETALALIALDGVARRLVICPPGVPDDHLSSIIEAAEIDTVVSDSDAPRSGSAGVPVHVTCGAAISPAVVVADRQQTEWVLLTSGTSGKPKMIRHSVATLTAAIKGSATRPNEVIWGTFYDIRRYGGLQIFLRWLLGNGSFVMSSVDESIEDYLVRLGARHATHVTGTASHWRSALWSRSLGAIAPRYVRLSGEIADQTLLDGLRSHFPNAGISHAFASTEAGVGFAVTDGREGFPAAMIGAPGDVELKITDHSLRIRSPGCAVGHIGGDDAPLTDAEGFVDTGDIVQLRGDRYYFLGRATGVINVGGLKVHPEEVEGVINRHPDVAISRVRPRKNPILGFVVTAEVVLKTATDPHSNSERTAQVKREILQLCSKALVPYKIPVTLEFVLKLDVVPTGKMGRLNA
jgi:acyl-coenzyme A synthetase/AMP-(fatty) acid ligase